LNQKFFEYAFPLCGNALYGFAPFPGDTFVCSALGEPPQEPLLSRGQQEIEVFSFAIRTRVNLGLIYLKGHHQTSLFLL